MKKRIQLNLLTGILSLAGLLAVSAQAGSTDSLSHFPKDKSPEVIGKRLVENLLASDHKLVKGYKFIRTNHSIHYAEICAAWGALGFTELTNDRDLLLDLERRYRPIVDEENSDYIPKGYHGDFTASAHLYLKLYQLRGDKRFYRLGMGMIKKQWENPNPEDGLTWQARYWNDDVFMIGSVNALATRVTGDQTHVNNAARLVDAYMRKLQHENGLVTHTTHVPFYWGRGMGWVAVGITEVLRTLPENHPLYNNILGYYQKMMAGLLPLQTENGRWRQLVDQPDAWEESSCTGMFTYAMITGVKQGWLDAKTYGPAARNGWLGLIGMINENGDVRDVCIGTNEQKTKEGYMKRKRLLGDFHGQAPVLWCANALLR